MIRAFLFDKDATLLDFEKTWGAWSRAFLEDLAVGDDALLARLASVVGFHLERMGFANDSPVIAGTPEDSVELLLPLLPEWSFDDLLSHSNAMAREVKVHPIAPLSTVLEALSAKVRLGIATNDSAEAARRHMMSLDVAHLFDAILGSDSGFGGKPGPGMCLAFAKQLGIEPAEVAMVGDSAHDMEAGRRAGMVCIGVASGFATAQELDSIADHVLPDVTHLPGWLEAYE
ncbi:MAG: HAD family hydrolase [Pseudomonadota bacterium]